MRKLIWLLNKNQTINTISAELAFSQLRRLLFKVSVSRLSPQAAAGRLFNGTDNGL